MARIKPSPPGVRPHSRAPQSAAAKTAQPTRRAFIQKSGLALATLLALAEGEPSTPVARTLNSAKDYFDAIPAEFRDTDRKIIGTSKKIIDAPGAKNTLVVIRQIHASIGNRIDSNEHQKALVGNCQNSIDSVLRTLYTDPSIKLRKLYSEGITQTVLDNSIKQGYEINLTVPEKDRGAKSLETFIKRQTNPDTVAYLRAATHNSAAHRYYFSGRMQPMVAEREDYPETSQYLQDLAILSPRELAILPDLFHFHYVATGQKFDPNNIAYTNFDNIFNIVLWKHAFAERLKALPPAKQAQLLEQSRAVVQKPELAKKGPDMALSYMVYHVLSGAFNPGNGLLDQLIDLHFQLHGEREKYLLTKISETTDPIAVAPYGAMHNWTRSVREWNANNSDKKISLIEITPQEVVQLQRENPGQANAADHVAAIYAEYVKQKALVMEGIKF